MLSGSEFLQFRPQNEEPLPDCSQFTSSVFLPANFYPIQSPGYTAHWKSNKLVIVERSGETAKIVVEQGINDFEIAFCHVFDTLPMKERRKRKVKRPGRPGKGFIGNLAGWFKNQFNWNNSELLLKDSDSIEIVKIVSLMVDRTLFDAVVVISKCCNLTTIYGFIRFRELMTGNLKLGGRIDRIDGFIPALEMGGTGKNSQFIQWKNFLIFIGTNCNCLKYLNLNEGMEENDGWIEAELSLSEEFKSGNLNVNLNVIVCEDKMIESNRVIFLLQEQDDNGNLNCQLVLHLTTDGTSVIVRMIPVKLEGFTVNCGYIEDDYLYLVQGTKLIQLSNENYNLNTPLNDISGDTSYKSIPVTFLLNSECPLVDPSTDSVYLFPWRQDLQVSALLFYLTRSRDEYRISVLSITGTKSEIVLESEWFRNEFEFRGNLNLFAASSLELFLMDQRGGVLIYAGMLLRADWQWRHTKKAAVSFEFARWFNILGEFPFKSAQFYSEQRDAIKTSLFIDDFLREEGLHFPPSDWKGLGQACLRLKNEKIDLILYYLLAAKGTISSKLASFYDQYGLNDKQVAAIEIAFAADHAEYGRAVQIFCTRKLDDSLRSALVPKLVRMLSAEELTKFSLFSVGRLISLDLLFEDDETLNLILSSLMKTRAVSDVLEWIKGLFAWLRPDERCALIPVATLHQTLLKQMLNLILKISCNSEFKQLANEFVEANFDPDTLKSILESLTTGKYGDRAAWMITMICASRGRLHEYLLSFDFRLIVQDDEVLKGIEAIKSILRPLVDEKNCYRVDVDVGVDSSVGESPVIVPETPQMLMKRSAQSLSSGGAVRKPVPPLFNVYARTPSSPCPIAGSTPNSPTFTPRHYPPKKRTTLLSSTLKNDEEEVAAAAEEEEESDPFKADLIKFGGEKRRREDEEDFNKIPKMAQETVGDVVMLTKSSDTVALQFESVIEVRASKRRRRRRE